MKLLVDAHNHITTKLPIKSIYNTYRYEQILSLKSITNGFYNIGIHPEYINDDFIDTKLLTDLLRSDSINIGEVGLDKRFNNSNKQIEGLKFFFDLAVENKKSVTIHCVKRWGDLTIFLKKYKDSNLKLLFHGYAGSIETVKELIKYSSYFSFSTRELKMDRLIRVIKSVPIDKILIESDMNQADFNQIGLNGYLDSLERSYNRLAEILNEPKNRVISQINSNFVNFTLKDNT